MKPTITAICLLVSSFCFSVFAQKPIPDRSRISLSEIVTTLSVAENLDVVLTSDQSTEIEVEGSARNLTVHLADGHLHLSQLQLHASPLKVYVPAAYLSKVYMNGTGSLSSASILNSRRLQVILSGEARVAIRSTGHVLVETVDDIRFVKTR